MRVIYFAPAAVWFAISIILLTLPGNDLPQSSLLNLPYFDKFVHLVMFFLLTILFSYPFSKMPAPPAVKAAIFNKVALYVILYGILMEFIQKFFTSARSFDVIDILFDSLGSVSGLLTVRQYALKKIGPNENRGRNQN